jgi:hypothetical protein
MREYRTWSWLLASAGLLAGCSGTASTPSSAPALATSAPPTTAAPIPTPIPGAPLLRDGVFSVAIIVDAQLPEGEGAQQDVLRVFDRANRKLFQRTGEAMRLTEVVYGMARGSSVAELAFRYARSVARDPPDGVVILTNDATASLFGGYSFSIDPGYPYTNEYPSARPGIGPNRLHVGVIDFTHPYSRCGYDDAGNRVSDFSVGGECRNHPGVSCVRRPSGRAEWTCPDTGDDLYSDHDYFVGCNMVHEFMHAYGFESDGNLDHWATPPCLARSPLNAMGNAQDYCGMCPDVYPRFRGVP